MIFWLSVKSTRLCVISTKRAKGERMEKSLLYQNTASSDRGGG